LIEIARDLVEEIVSHARAEYPNECCGLLAGEDGRAVRVYRMTNADASTASYRLDPKEHLEVFDELEEKRWDLLAIYHSHTHSPAYPSETDRKLAFYPESRYLIVSLAGGEAPDLRAFRIDDGEVAEEEVRVT